MNSLAGKLLIASPKMSGTPFDRTVVLLLQDDDDGTIGVVLNRPADDRMRAVWTKITDGLEGHNERLFMGGPMSGPIVAIHGMRQFGELNPTRDIFAAATQDNLKQLVEQEESPYRIFFGLSAWKPGQLEQELGQGAWLTTEAKHDHVFNDHADLWGATLRAVGNEVIERIVGVGRLPSDPTVN